MGSESPEYDSGDEVGKSPGMYFPGANLQGWGRILGGESPRTAETTHVARQFVYRLHCESMKLRDYCWSLLVKILARCML